MGAEVASATLNGKRSTSTAYREDDGIALPGLAAENELRVVALGRYMNTGEGLHRFVDPVDGAVYLYSQFETADCKRMFACFDQPDLKARYTLTVTAPADWKVVSNATAEVEQGGRPRCTASPPPRSSPPTWWRWSRARTRRGTTSTPTTGRGDIPLGCTAAPRSPSTWTPSGCSPRPSRASASSTATSACGTRSASTTSCSCPSSTRARWRTRARSRSSRTTSSAPASPARSTSGAPRPCCTRWRTCGSATSSPCAGGTTCGSTSRSRRSRRCSARPTATEYTEAWTTFANVEKSWAYRQDQLPSTHPVAADIPDLQAVEVNFDGITYAKGASVLKQLVAYVGLEPFLAGLRAYFTAHAWGNATFDDLIGALEQASGRDLSGWGEQWLRTTGLNMLRPSFDLDDDGAFTRFEVVQGGARPGAGELRTHRIAVGDLRRRRVRQARAHPPGRGGRRGRAHPGARAGRRVARQAGAGQRRRPHLLRAAARPGLARHAGGPHRRHRRAAAAHPVLVGGVGDDPRGRAEGPRLRRARRGRARPPSRRSACVQRLLLQAQTAIVSYADAGVGGRAGLAAAGRRAAVPARHR